MPRRAQAVSRQRAPAGGRAPAPGSRPGARGRGGLTALLAAVVLAAAILPFASSASFDFVWDDHVLIGPHLDIRSPGDVARIAGLPFDSPLRGPGVRTSYARPVTLLSLAWDRALHGGNPAGYHVTNLAFYAAACLLLWLFAWELSGRPIASAGGAVLFALHPTHPETVCFISGRTDAMAAAFLFAALWSAARWGTRRREPRLKLAAAAALLLVGMGCKEIAFFAAPLLPLILWVRDRSLGLRTLLAASIPVAGACAVYLVARRSILGAESLPDVAFVSGALPQALTSLALVARYLPMLFFPVALSARHDFAPVLAPDTLVLAGAAVVAAIAIGLAVLIPRRSRWAVPLALFAATLLPICYVRILYGTILAERFLFVPSAALALAAALAPSSRGGDARPAYGLALVALAGLSLALLLPRVGIWRDNGTLYASMVRDSPRSAYAHAVLASHLRGRGDLAPAESLYRRAYRLQPTFPEPLLDLAGVEAQRGRIDSAFVHLRLLLRLRPTHAEAWYTLGNLFVGIDQPDSAMRAYETALRLRPELAEAENNLGAVLERIGRVADAEEHYRRALAIDPANGEASRNLERLGIRKPAP